MLKRHRTKILWILCIVGLIGSAILGLPSLEGVDVNLPPDPETHAPSLQFPVPEPIPRSTGSLLVRPFLFELASSDKMTGPQRESKMLARYEEIVDRLNSDSVPKVEVNTSAGVATVNIDGAPFATVLPQDCPEYYTRLSDDKKLLLEKEVAYSWAEVIEDDLQFQSIKRHPAYLKFYNYVTVLSFWLVCLATLFLTWLSRRFVRSPLWSFKVLLWLIFLTGVTMLHPSLDNLANALYRGGLYPLFLLIVCFVSTALMHQATTVAIHRYFRALAEYDKGASQGLRAALRRQTLEQACSFVSRVTWSFLGLCLYLYSLGVDLGSFFAGAGLVGVAIGVMARDIFLDFFNGINILAEDQFGVGDWIETNTDSGEVVAFSLRATKIRRTDGSLATLSNSEMRRVRNHSNEFSMVDFRVSVTYDTNTDKAMAMILDEIALLETEWQEKIAEPPNPLGVHELALDGVILRVMLKTIPLAQWETHRRLNRRVKMRFDHERVEFAAPRRAIAVRPGIHREPFLVQVNEEGEETSLPTSSSAVT